MTKILNTNMLPAVLLTRIGEEDEEAQEDAPSVKIHNTLLGGSVELVCMSECPL